MKMKLPGGSVFVSTQRIFLTEVEKNRRLAICSQCPIFSNGWCDRSKGGCGCNVYIKASLQLFHCPIRKW